MGELISILVGAILDVLVGAILEPLLGFIAHLVLGLLLYLVAIPLFGVVSTPVVLVHALFGPGCYADKVVSGYKGVFAGLTHIGWTM